MSFEYEGWKFQLINKSEYNNDLVFIIILILFY